MHKAKKILEWFLIIIIAICALILSFLLSYQQVYAGKIYRNVYFGTLNLSGLSKKEAVNLLEHKFKDLENEQITVTCGNKKVKAILKDTGLSFSSDQIAEKIYDTGRSSSFWSNFIRSSSTLIRKTTIVGVPTVDQTALNNFIDIAVKQLNTEPVDANLTIQDGQINEIKSQSGQIADTNGLMDKIIQMVSSGSKEIALSTIERPATIQSNDFSAAKAGAENLLSKNISLTYQDQKYQPSRKDIGKWIVFNNIDGKYKADLDQSNIKAYLNEIAVKFEVTKKDRKIDNNGSVLQEGKDGIYLDKDSVVKQLLDQIPQKSEISFEMVVNKVPSKEIVVSMTDGVETGRFSGKYIDVNLTTQRFCRLDGQTLIDCFMTSTGKPSTPTPVGSFAITRKNPMGWAPNPGVSMPWFQEFKVGGWGIHELVIWPDGHHEPITNLGQTVSHGCVRLAPGTAEMVFRWTEIGTPVYVHK